MKILVVGSEGMLGAALMRARTYATEEITMVGVSHARLDITSLAQVDVVLGRDERADVVINAAGVIPLRGRPASEMVVANAYGPHLLAEACERHGSRLIHVSTDCVFSGDSAPFGNQGRYRPEDAPDPDDVYGRSKLAGEPEGAHVAVIRTSFVGPEHGLWRWLADQPQGAVIEGWENARWTGSTVDAAAAAILRYAMIPVPGQARRYIEHLSTRGVVSKYEVLTALAERLGREDLSILPMAEPAINRALEPTIWLTEFREALDDWTPL